MFNYNPLDCLPSSAELPDSNDTPVDSELQILIPNLLLAILPLQADRNSTGTGMFRHKT
ncbi:hypothetical protein [Iningainema tapete]|uniref:hypothetical protein n=1 Tax=Iningainema tapete TaxID=2806730 RepID=UPI003B585BA5